MIRVMMRRTWQLRQGRSERKDQKRLREDMVGTSA